MPSPGRNQYESQLALAHRIVYNALGYAQTVGEDGAAEDLYEISVHLKAMLEDSVNGRKRKLTRVVE